MHKIKQSDSRFSRVHSVCKVHKDSPISSCMYQGRTKGFHRPSHQWIVTAIPFLLQAYGPTALAHPFPKHVALTPWSIVRFAHYVIWSCRPIHGIPLTTLYGGRLVRTGYTLDRWSNRSCNGSLLYVHRSSILQETTKDLYHWAFSAAHWMWWPWSSH